MKRISIILLALWAASGLSAAGKDRIISTRAAGNVTLHCDAPGTWSFLTDLQDRDGKEILTVSLQTETPAIPPQFSLSFSVPQQDIHHLWTVNGSARFAIQPDWAASARTNLAVGMPLYAFFNDNSTNRLVVACDEVFRDVQAVMGLREEGCRIVGKLTFFTVKEAPASRYRVSICLDSRDVFWSESIREAALWMGESAGCTPCRVPDAAYEPLYSSWYQFHQQVEQQAIEEECRQAAGLGMKTLIVDDGWQTDDNNRGYAFCGDWKVSRNRFPDFPAHVKRVREMGIRYMLWYSVPFIGEESDNYERFQGKYLYHNAGLRASVLDPRFPDVRKFLIDTYVQAAKEWGLDGFKLDFIDSFTWFGDDPALREGFGSRDIRTVPAAVDALMTGIRDALQAIRPDMLIEFRQSYVGPAIARYGNMFRVGDCPGDHQQNRIGICNLRLGAPGVAVHADMIEWNPEESPEQAARAILSAMFGVIQYSVMLREIPQAHRDLIRHWLNFSQQHKEALLKGYFKPYHPEAGYPVIEAGNAEEAILGIYQDNVMARVSEGGKPVYVLNASGSDHVLLNLPARPGKVEAYDLYGRPVKAPRLAKGLNEAAVPCGGYLVLR